MSSPSPSSELPSAGLSHRALERALDELAQQVRGDVEPLGFFGDVLRLLVHTARADAAAVWMRAADQSWTRVALSIDAANGAVQSEANASPPDWLAAALSQTEPQTARLTRNGDAGMRIAAAIRQGGQPVGVLEGTWEGTPSPGTLLPFVGALCELSGDFLVQHELRMLRRERVEWKQWEQFQTALSDAAGLQKLAAVITHDGRALTGSDRVTVLRLSGLRARAESVSGVDVLDPRSTTLQAIERLAYATARLGQPVWHSTDAPHAGLAREACEALQHIAQNTAITALPLASTDRWLSGVLICERFTTAMDTTAWQKRCESLARFVLPAWSVQIERQLGWLGRWSRQRHRLTAQAGRIGLAAAFVAAIVLALLVIPAEHVVTGEGQLQPEQRRDVFASTSGLISEIRVHHGEEVAEGQTLLVLRDPQAELESTRVVGELATVQARLGVIQAARIAATSSGVDATVRAQQLTAEEEELRQRLASLTRQQALLDEQRARWELKSPIAGQVLTWDLESRLAGRPVERGQVLLTVGDVAGQWIIEAQIRERDVHALWEARQNHSEVPVKFVSTLDPQIVRTGVVSDVARTMDISDQGVSTLRVTIAFDRDQPGALRPGVTVLPRIHCGQKSLGYVWLHQLFDAVRRQWWRWW